MPKTFVNYPTVYAPLASAKSKIARGETSTHTLQINLPSLRIPPIWARAISLTIMGASNTVLAAMICYYFLSPKVRPHTHYQSVASSTDSSLNRVLSETSPSEDLHANVIPNKSSPSAAIKARVAKNDYSQLLPELKMVLAEAEPVAQKHVAKTGAAKDKALAAKPSEVKVSRGPAAGNTIKVGVPF